MRRIVLVGVVIVTTCILLAGTQDGLRAELDDAGLKEDYLQLEGSWEREQRDSEGNVSTVIKSERDRKSVVTVYDHKGNVLHSHTSDYELKRCGDMRIFRYWNRTVTQGPDKGSIQKEPREYIYKIVGDRFYEIQGAMISQQRESPRIGVWKRRDKEV